MRRKQFTQQTEAGWEDRVFVSCEKIWHKRAKYLHKAYSQAQSKTEPTFSIPESPVKSIQEDSGHAAQKELGKTGAF